MAAGETRIANERGRAGPGDDGFTTDEVSLVRGMARVLELTVETLVTFAAERHQATENARLVTSLRERNGCWLGIGAGQMIGPLKSLSDCRPKSRS